jgi:hypothetical protein
MHSDFGQILHFDGFTETLMRHVVLRSEVTRGLPLVVKRTCGVLESAMSQRTRETVPRFSVPPHLRKFWESAANRYVLILSHIGNDKVRVGRGEQLFQQTTKSIYVTSCRHPVVTFRPQESLPSNFNRS